MLRVMRRMSICESTPSVRASLGILSTAGANCLGLTQIESTGVLMARGSPLRSVIVPRWAEIFSVRRWRVSACLFRKSLSSTCKYTARATSDVARTAKKTATSDTLPVNRRAAVCFVSAPRLMDVR